MYEISIYKKDQLIGHTLFDIEAVQQLIIGRCRTADIELKGLRVSKKHAQFVFNKGVLTVKDLNSMSGTYVNGDRIIISDPIADLDDIKISDYILNVKKKQSTKYLNRKRTSIANSDASPEKIIEGDAPSVEPSPSFESKEHNANRSPEFYYWREKIHALIIDEMDLRRTNINEMTEKEVRSQTGQLIDEIIDARRDQLDKCESIDLNRLKKCVLDDAIGLGPLEELLMDTAVSEIMVNSPKEIFIEKNGKIVRSDFQFKDDQAVRSVIDRIITPLGRRVDESSPMVDARLRDGSRVNAIIPPLAIKGPCITIRKFSQKRLAISDLIQYGSLDHSMARFLNMIVFHKKNIIVSGGTGTGKTSLLNVLSNIIPDNERIITVEDAAELKLNQPDLVSLEAKPANVEGKGAITIRDLVKNSLRMRPDRVIVGECRGGETLDMLQAMNTGHDGSLTTIHANSPRDSISRLEVLVLMAGMELPIAAIREQIASAVSFFIQLTRFPCGSRKITSITEVSGVESGIIQLQDIFRFRQKGIDQAGQVKGHFYATGVIPNFLHDLDEMGFETDKSLFRSNYSNEHLGE